MPHMIELLADRDVSHSLLAIMNEISFQYEERKVLGGCKNGQGENCEQ